MFNIKITPPLGTEIKVHYECSGSVPCDVDRGDKRPNTFGIRPDSNDKLIPLCDHGVTAT